MWDERYSQKEYVYGKQPNDFLQNVSHHLPAAGKTLCLCAGEGRNAVFLAEQGHHVTAVDYSSVGLEKTEQLAAERSVPLKTIHDNWSERHIETNTWDTIVSFFCHFPPDLRRRIHRETVAGLRKNGAFVMEAFTPEQLQYDTGGPPSRELLMTLDSLKKELDGLSFQFGREQKRIVNEGKYHTGTAAVVQILAFKS